jgi:hypothetical protein
MAAQNDVLKEVKIIPFSEIKVWTEVKNGSMEQSKYSGIKRTGHENMIEHCDRLKDIIVKNFDMESFLLGTLDDYYERKQSDDDIVDTYYQVDTFWPHGRTLAMFIDTLFSSAYDDLYVAESNLPQNLALHSKQLSKTVNAYYDYGTGTGILKPDRFLTEQQKLSFIAGSILRHGVIKTNISGVYCIAFPNSHNNAELCERFLNELGCRDVEYHIMHGHIPAGHMVYFKASSKINKIIQEFEKHTGNGKFEQ